MSTAPQQTQDLRKLSFASEEEIIAELRRLRGGGYVKRGNWTLPQMCAHIAAGLEGRLSPPASTQATPEQAAMKKGLVDLILSTGKPPPGLQAPPHMVPPEHCDDTQVARLEGLLLQLKAYPHSHIDFGPFGPVPADEMRQLTRLHCAHHLAFLEPKTPPRRRGLNYANEEAAVEDVQRLRRGYTRAGNWTLAQICWHLDKTTAARMAPGPFPPNTPEQDARKDVLKQVLASGQLPMGIQAPDLFVPPADAGETAIDDCIATMRRFAAYRGPIAPHRIFGHLSEPDIRRLNLIHCANHLSYLTPTNA